MTTEPTKQPQPGKLQHSIFAAAMPLWPVAFARMLIGVLWLFSLRWKLPPSFDGGSQRGLRVWLELEVEHPVVGFYGELIDNVVLPNFKLFAWLLFLTELVVGLSLLFGFFTRLGAAIGLAMALNLGIGLAEVPGEWPWSYMMLAMWHGLFLVAGAGRVLGLDARLRSRFLSPDSSPDLTNGEQESSKQAPSDLTSSEQTGADQPTVGQHAITLLT